MEGCWAKTDVEARRKKEKRKTLVIAIAVTECVKYTMYGREDVASEKQTYFFYGNVSESAGLAKYDEQSFLYQAIY